MGSAGFSVGTFTGGGTFHVESQGGTFTPVGVMAWGGAGTVTRVGPGAAALPVNIAGGTLNAGTVSATVTNTGTVVGTVGISGGTISTIAAGTVAISTIAAGTVVATAAGTQTVAGTVSVSGGTIGLSGGTISTIAAGTVAISGGTVNPSRGQGKTLLGGTINLTSGSVSLVNPGSGTTAYIVGMAFTVGTAGIIQFLQGVGAPALSGPMHLDQYGGLVDRGQPSAPVLIGAAGSQIYLSITSGIGTIGGYYTYYTEV